MKLEDICEERFSGQPASTIPCSRWTSPGRWCQLGNGTRAAAAAAATTALSSDEKTLVQLLDGKV